MPTLVKTIFLVCLCAAASVASQAATRWETLRAINLVENPTNHARMGANGELGPYQFRSQTWRLHSRRPFSQATERAAADEVAVKHYEWIRRGLRDAGIDDNAYNIALAWNCGLGAVREGRVPASSYRYAELVTNLVSSMARSAEPTARAEAPKPVEEASPVPPPAAVVANAAADHFMVVTAPGPRFFVRAIPAAPTVDPVVYTEQALPDLRVEKPAVTVKTLPAPAFALIK